MNMLTQGAARARGEDQITMPVLAQYLPRHKKYIHGDSMIIYAAPKQLVFITEAIVCSLFSSFKMMSSGYFVCLGYLQ